MQNTTLGSKGTSKQLHNVAESARDTAEQMASDVSSKASRLATDTAESAGEMYEKASSWMQQNYGKTLSIVGSLAAVGMIGYLIGRNNNRSDMQLPPQQRI